jgi:hypothetical protein
MLDKSRVAPIDEASGKPPYQREAPVELPQQQRSGIRPDVSALEIRHHRAPFDSFKSEKPWGTLCRRRGVP